ncbi:MAG: VOC family protein [Gemmatimonadota bacterium]
MKAAHPYLNFPGNAEEAFAFYRSVFGGDFTSVMRFRDMGQSMGVRESDADKIAHISLPLGENATLMATDRLASFPVEHRPGNNFFITLDPETAEEADRLFEALSNGGSVEMPLQQTEWAEKYGTCSDPFGIQ